MIKAILLDFSRVLLFPKDKSYTGSLNDLHRQNLIKDNYSIFDYFELNNELLAFLEKLKNKYKLYILTSETIQDAPEFAPYLSPLFTKVYSALKIGFKKDESRIYHFIAQDIGFKEEEILFIDDTQKNLIAAQRAGLQTIHYISNKDIIALRLTS